MPPSTPLKTNNNEKDVELFEYNGAINQLITIAKKELEDVKNQINTENYNLAMLRDKRNKDSQELESFKRAEKLKFTNDLTTRQNDIIANQNRINMEVLQQERITADLRTQQTKFETLNQERIALKEELVKLEGKKIEIADMFKQAESMKSSVLASQNQGNMALQKASEEAEKNKQENIRLVQLNDQLEKRAKQIEEDAKNLETLKEFVEPKIRAIKDEQEALDKAKIENLEYIAKLNQTMQDEKILLQSVLDKKAQLEKDMSSFVSQKQEFERTQLLSPKVANATS